VDVACESRIGSSRESRVPLPSTAPVPRLSRCLGPGTVSGVNVMPMSWLQVVVLSIVQGLTEFLPISSSAHLAIVSRVFFAGDAGASFTAVSQLGTEAAVLVYFARDIARILKAWFNGLFVRAHRSNPDYRMGWYVIIGTIPIGVLGFLFKDVIRSGARNLWLIATAMLVFSAVIAAAEYFGRQDRHVEQLTWRDGLLGEIRLPACHSGGVGLRAVLPARCVPSGQGGYERDGRATRRVGGDCLRCRPGCGELAASFSHPPRHVLVRRLPRGARVDCDGTARRRRGGCDVRGPR